MTQELFNNSVQLIEKVRQERPIVHQITNYVTVNDCANVTLAVGGAPVMADEKDEVREIVSLASALVLNIGTLNRRTIESMLFAAERANERGIPVILDPVGAGASLLRTESVKTLLAKVRVDVIRGNFSEIHALSGDGAGAKGVDVSDADKAIGVKEIARVGRNLALSHRCAVAITGKIDCVVDETRLVCVENGHPLMSSITGTGCMCSALVGTFCAVSRDPFLGALAGVLCMGIAGEVAHERAGAKGNGSYRMALLDAVSLMDEEILLSKGRCYEPHN